MSAAASPSLPRTPSTTKRHAIPTSTERQSQSATTSRHGDTASPRRSESKTHTQAPHSRSASAAAQQAQLANVAQRDFEQTNLDKPTVGHRIDSKDSSSRGQTLPRSQSVRVPPPTSSSSRPTNGRRESEGPLASNAPGSMTLTEKTTRQPSATDNSTQQRRRTTVEATTGTWELGKTIGAGSMGKVKLAKNKKTGEEVRSQLYITHHILCCNRPLTTS